ncbi:MAG: ribbon-helix-helix protein, CopG family [Prosthecobacter sp.]|uniref:ribbon-helix-helix protein, CopG family n=1 Tax=Prosthecobacter sp. TaxID=1965333 RepID=UPI003BB03B12
MQKIQILFPDPLMEMLRNLARAEDRPVSEIVRRAVDRDLEQRAGMLKRSNAGARPPAFPTFGGGRVLAKASEMKALIHGDEMP